VIAEAAEVHLGPHQVASELVQTFGVTGKDGGSVVNAEAAPAPRQQELDALVAQKVLPAAPLVPESVRTTTTPRS
jgi:hypothetical protein